MKVFELIDELSRYNPKADINVVVNGCPKPFEICFGTSEGCTTLTCNSVGLMVETSTEKGGETDEG